MSIGKIFETISVFDFRRQRETTFKCIEIMNTWLHNFLLRTKFERGPSRPSC